MKFFRPLNTLLVSICAFVTTTTHGDITVVTWGDAYEISQRKAYGEPWEKRTGRKISWRQYNGGLGEIRSQVELGEVNWDIVDAFPSDARVGCNEGLFMKLPRDRFTKAPDGTQMERDLIVGLPNECVVPNIVWSWLAFYDSKRFPKAKPKTIADFFDQNKFPGPRAISAFPQANIEMALVADGVDPQKVYEIMSTPEGIDRAFAKLDSIQDTAVFWSSGAEPMELITSGKVIMSMGYNGRISGAILEGNDTLVPIWDGQVLEEEWFVIVKGSKNYKEALDFLVHTSASEQQAAQAKWIPYGPMRKSALAIIAANEPWFHNGRDVMPHMPDRAEVLPRTVIANPDWWAVHGDKISERFKSWRER